ncbi:MAG TPA: aldose epimerase family protein [Draconibacterium sp.]|nr:aldose epimerase family protein [Draconibacterium sp.]
MKNTLILLLSVVLLSCAKPKNLPVLIDEDTFKTEHDGKSVVLFTLKNANGLVAQITNYGGKVINLWTPDKNGDFADIVIGYETSAEYLNTSEIYYGTLIGRYGNRIANGQFTLNDSVYTLARNNGENHLHGGIKGFNNVVWDAKKLDDQTLELTYLSVDGEEGYPGNLNVKVVYKLTNDDELKVEYWATTDKPTPINLTQHSFFNLKGAGNGDVNDHIMQIMADAYTPVDSTLIPTGEIAPVDGTQFDFRTPTTIGDRINDEHIQLKYGNGYDHNWVLNKAETGFTHAAKVVEPASGRTLEVFTNEPGMQFYGGNFMTGKDTGKGGKMFAFRGAFCLETQHFPDSPNKPEFPSTILNPGEEYNSVCVYKFGVEK